MLEIELIFLARSVILSSSHSTFSVYPWQHYTLAGAAASLECL